jgi:hypothetical protein
MREQSWRCSVHDQLVGDQQRPRHRRRGLARVAALGLLLPLAVVGCGGDDGDARADLPVDAQSNDVSESMTVVFPDGYPNSTHKCVDLAGVVIGIWTTTDRTVIWIYNDWACEGSSRESEMTVVNGVPRAVIGATGG